MEISDDTSINDLKRLKRTIEKRIKAKQKNRPRKKTFIL